jgi:hypothetical protein
MFFVGKMSSVDKLLAFAAIACVLKKKERKRRRLWRKEWLNRNNYTHINLLQECTQKTGTIIYVWMNMVSPHITKNDTCMRKAITPNEKLTATLRIKTPLTTWPWLNGGRKMIFHCARGDWTD